MPIQCLNCKSPNRDTADICEKCGKPLTATQEAVSSGNILKPVDPPQWHNPASTSPYPIPQLPEPKVREDYRGIVTKLRAESVSIQNQSKTRNTNTTEWWFELQRTEKNWQLSYDRKGFLLPLIMVKFKSDVIHGLPIEEGSQVAVHGSRKGIIFKGDYVIAKDIWNFSSPQLASNESKVFRGRVTSWQSRQTKDPRYPGQQRTVDIWSFRLQQTGGNFQEILRDVNGNPLPALPVEIRAERISGPLQDNDQVEVYGKTVDGTVYTSAVVNNSVGGAKLVVKGWAGIP